jgi:hypothetical protein
VQKRCEQQVGFILSDQHAKMNHDSAVVMLGWLGAMTEPPNVGRLELFQILANSVTFEFNMHGT